MARRWLFILIPALLSLTLSGCIFRPYRISVEQGNLMPPSKVAQIRRDMSKQQVIRILGTPLVHNFYADNKMVYAYMYKPGYGHLERKVLIITLSGNRVANIETHVDETKPETIAEP